jgi:aminocarboxymuconate-semialdehyde decarboxylase
MTKLGFAGIQIGSHVNKWPLSEPKLFPIFQEAERLGACIFVHPWDMLGEDVMSKYWLPWLVGMPMETAFAICSLIFGGVFERLPKLRWAFAHGGGAFPGTIGRIEHGFHVRPDLVAIDNKPEPRSYFGKFWVDSLVHDPVALKLLADLVGTDKIVCGSDYPFPLGEDLPGDLVQKATFLSEEEKQKILWKNGLDFLGLSEDRFTDTVDYTKTEEKTDETIKEKETIKETIKETLSTVVDQDAERVKSPQQPVSTAQDTPTAIVTLVS